MAVKQTAGRDALGEFALKFAQFEEGSNEWLEPVDDAYTSTSC